MVQTKIKTPTSTSWRAEGVRFTSFYAGSAAGRAVARGAAAGAAHRTQQQFAVMRTCTAAGEFTIGPNAEKCWLHNRIDWRVGAG